MAPAVEGSAKAPVVTTEPQDNATAPVASGSAQAAESSVGFANRNQAEAIASARRTPSARSHSSQNEFPVFEVALGGLGLLMYIMGSQMMGFMRSSSRPARVRR
jgi:hypothetical protein